MYNLHTRLLMAALHFNKNFDREQAKTASGSEQIRIVFSKHKKGEFTPKLTVCCNSTVLLIN